MKHYHWAIQDNLFDADSRAQLLQALDERGIPRTAISYEDGKFTCEKWPEGEVFAYGSHGLAKLAKARGWTPEAFLDEEDDHRRWNAHWGSAMLNADAVTCAFRDLKVPQDGQVFIRPAADNKLFHGMVLDADEVEGWRHSLLKGEASPIRCSASLSPDTLVTCGPPVSIMKEARFFIVQGRPVAWSTYRLNGKTVLSRDVGENAMDFVKQAVRVWEPSPAFVIDVALTPGGYRIIELNSINTSGMYAADPGPLVEAVEGLLPKPRSHLAAPARKAAPNL